MSYSLFKCNNKIERSFLSFHSKRNKNCKYNSHGTRVGTGQCLYRHAVCSLSTTNVAHLYLYCYKYIHKFRLYTETTHVALCICILEYKKICLWPRMRESNFFIMVSFSFSEWFQCFAKGVVNKIVQMSESSVCVVFSDTFVIM